MNTSTIKILEDKKERDRAEAALNDSRRYLQALFDNSLDGILVNDNEGRYIDANPAACALLGYTHAELIQLTVFDVTPECDRQAARAMWPQFLAKGSSTGEYSTLRKDGKIVQLEFRAVANILPGVHVSSSRDVTDHRRAEDGLRQSESQLAEAQRIAHIGSWSWNSISEIQVWSDELYRIYGLEPGTVSPTYENFLALVHSEDRVRLGEVVEHSTRTRELIDLYFRINRPDGEERIIHSQGRVLYDDKGSPIRTLGTARDVTEHWRAQKALGDAEQKYRDIFENALEGIFQTTPDGRFVVANPALASMFGFDSPSELIRERADISRQHYVDPNRRDEFKRLLELQGVVHDFEYEAIRKDGSPIWVSDDVRAVRDESGTVLRYEGVAKDITERKRAEGRTAAFATLAGKLSGARVPLSAARTIAETAQELFGWDSCALKLYDAKLDLLHPLLCIDTVGGQLTEVTPDKAETPAPRGRRVIDHGAQLNLRVEPYQFDADSVPFGDTHRPSISIMSVPVRHSSEVIGILSIQSYQPTAYDQEALGNLQALADHCGAALNRIRAEQALHESEERYRELFENAKDATYVHDLSGRYTSVNRAAERLSGHSREDIIGRRFTDFVPPEQIEGVGEHLCRKLVEKGETVYETEVVAHDGRRVPVEVRSHLIYRDGLAVGVQGTARDITERKQAEDQLRQAKDFSENLIETANVIILGLDLEGNIQIFNQTAEKITGYTAAELKGQNWFEKLVPRDRYPHVWAEFFTVVGGPAKTFENPILTKSGEERYIRWRNNQVRVDGKVVATISFGNDITERRRAEEALRQSEERFSKAFHSSPAALSITLLEDGRLLEVNAAFLRMTGFTREEVIGRSTLELGLWASDYRAAMAAALREHGAVADLEIKFQKKSGEIRDGLLSAELIHLGAEPSVLGIAQDVTERNRAAQALLSYPRQLIEAQETERQLIASELHDQIGQVLTAVHLNLQTVWKTCRSSEERALIEEGVTIVDEALAQVRNLSFELRPSLLDDLGLLTALRWFTGRFAQRTGIHVTADIELAESPIRLRRELETACFRIVQEALTNVVRHAKASNVSISLRNLEEQVRLSIKDDGAGFDVNSQNLAVFTGCVGLRGMRERALAVGGRLEIRSSASQGTEIRAHLPRESSET